MPRQKFSANKNAIGLYCLGLVFMAAVFCARFVFPAGLAWEVLYALPVLISLWLPGHGAALGFALIATAFAGFDLGWNSGKWSEIGNGLLAVGMIWSTVVFMFFYKRHEQLLQTARNALVQSEFRRACQLEASNRELQAEIAERRRAEMALAKNEQRYRSLIENQPDLICRFKPDGALTYINRAYAAYFGKTVAELIGFNFFALLPEPAQESARRHLANLGPANPVSTLEHEVRLPGGTTRWQRWTDLALLGEDGTVCEFQSIGHDITERRRAEEALRASEERLRLVLDATSDGIFEWDLRNDEVYWSDRLYEILGLTPGSIQPSVSLLLRLTHPDDWEKHERVLRRHRTEGAEYALEVRMKRGDGSYIWVLVLGNTLRNSAGQPLRIIGSIIDISKRKQAEKRLLRAQEEAAGHREQLAHISRLYTIGEMAAGIAHEINQPLAAIESYARACKNRIQAGTNAPEKMHELIDKILGQAKRTGNIITRLRAMVKKQEFKSALMDLSELLQEGVKLASFDARLRECTIELHLAPGLPPVVVDDVQIQQVIINLIRNGMDAMETITDKKIITIEAKLNIDQDIEISVIDSGVGITELQVNRLFEPFYSTKKTGLGVGLAICRNIIHAHGGRIWYTPNPAGGAIFHFTLPVTSVGLDRDD